MTAPSPRSEQDTRDPKTAVAPARSGASVRSVSPAERDATAARDNPGLGTDAPLPDRRQGRYTVLPRSGALLNEDAYRDWVGAIDRRAPKRARVERLSSAMPELQIEGRPAA